MNRPSPRPFRSRRGFTLVELLTVIGIIVVLVSILLPTVGKVRTQALVASTQQQIATIGGAIERYKLEQGMYPGVMPNSAFTSSGMVTVTPGSQTMTMTEMMVVALCGGLQWNTGNTAITFDPNLVGRGAVSLGPSVGLRKKYPAYLDASAGQMLPNQPWRPNSDNADGETPGTAPGTGDTAIPELMDRFPISRPILYVRANLGGSGITSPVSPSTIPQYSTPLFDPYKRGDPTPNNAQSTSDFPGDFVFRTVNPPDKLATDYKTFDDYLRNPSGGSTPRRKDSFLLISAGPDNAFGTRDDIFFGQ